jgi:DNA-binding transcriptional regulator GbsR (MarR family)
LIINFFFPVSSNIFEIKENSYIWTMNFEEAKERYIQAWGALGSNWGVNRTMAQIHALLLVASEPLSADEIMDQLDISRGNVNMNVRALIDWGLVRKEHKPKERREYFVAEKDVWRVGMLVTRERRKRELAPVIQTLEEVRDFEADPEDPEVKAFQESTENLRKFVGQMDRLLEVMIKSDRQWFSEMLVKILEAGD